MAEEDRFGLVRTEGVARKKGRFGPRQQGKKGWKLWWHNNQPWKPWGTGLTCTRPLRPNWYGPRVLTSTSWLVFLARPSTTTVVMDSRARNTSRQKWHRTRTKDTNKKGQTWKITKRDTANTANTADCKNTKRKLRKNKNQHKDNNQHNLQTTNLFLIL